MFSCLREEVTICYFFQGLGPLRAACTGVSHSEC